MKLVLVHGRDQQNQDAAVLQKSWIDTLNAGLKPFGSKVSDKVEVSFPYYGDVLAKRVSELDLPVGDTVRTRGGAIDPEYQQFRGEMIEELRRGAHVTDADVNQEYGNNPKPKAPQNWEWVQAILRALDRKVPSLGAAVVERFTRDVFVYLTDDAVRATINKIVSDTLTTDTTVVVGHSLGSVVAYDVLRTDKRKLSVPLYVTIGSPLGIELIRSKLRPVKFPKPIVKRWFNAYDQKDVIALYPLDNTNFDVRPDSIDEFSRVKNTTDNHHGISGYLNDKAVAEAIFAELK